MRRNRYKTALSGDFLQCKVCIVRPFLERHFHKYVICAVKAQAFKSVQSVKLGIKQNLRAEGQLGAFGGAARRGKQLFKGCAPCRKEMRRINPVTLTMRSRRNSINSRFFKHFEHSETFFNARTAVVYTRKYMRMYIYHTLTLRFPGSA